MLKKNKYKIRYVLLFFAFVLMLKLVLVPIYDNDYYFHAGNDIQEYVINPNDIFSQSFVSKVNNLNKIMIMFNSSSTDDNCPLEVKILNDNNESIVSSKLTDRKLDSGEYQNIVFSKIVDSKNQKYEINIINSCSKSISLWFYTDKKNGIKYNEKLVDKSLFFCEIGLKKQITYIWYPLMIIIFDLIYIALNQRGKKKYDKKII